MLGPAGLEFAAEGLKAPGAEWGGSAGARSRSTWRQRRSSAGSAATANTARTANPAACLWLPGAPAPPRLPALLPHCSPLRFEAAARSAPARRAKALQTARGDRNPSAGSKVY